ncbi:helix-turn-helix transcriptional regulator [Aerosakkonema funiforme]|uniref:Helix-turn-helix domain-containing protein n=1 Tax=Aerosakkonema funiforme FACHB-1375 TaxID=2949571 RepID=A0A926ZI29_9CYAN|nr:helix-turn-helix domain-containing protein [Aerosakkonema funiforme]MBD2181371.1 helix-turn-helix domain-containing protein [Aerosakkonema funiforme FACHB-1375]
MPSNNEQFTEAANHWDLETLYTDLASAKGKRLTSVEKLHLRGLLCGYSPAEIAQILHKSIKGVESEVCTTLYPYVKNLVGKCNEKVENWRNICEWLEEAGYKSNLYTQQLINPIPVDILGKIANIKIEKDKITIEIDLRQTNAQSSELPKQNLNFDDNNTN